LHQFCASERKRLLFRVTRNFDKRILILIPLIEQS
jgi:hypothetical protein